MAEEDLCRCGHPREAHEHYRRGSDCGECGAEKCGAFGAAVTEQANSETAPHKAPYDPAVGA
jgi:hypothetical protein